MSSLNQHDTVKTMFRQLTGTFDRTEPTVSYDSMPTTMIWLIQSDIGRFWCPKRLKFLGWQWLFTFIQLKVQNNLWGCICKIFNFISHRSWFPYDLNFIVQVSMEWFYQYFHLMWCKILVPRLSFKMFFITSLISRKERKCIDYLSTAGIKDHEYYKFILLEVVQVHARAHICPSQSI